MFHVSTGNGTPTRIGRFFTVAGAILLCAVGLVLLFARAVDRDLNHDEHQFLAPAALLSREGLLPWRDYPLFHLPNLVFVYGGLDWISGNVLLAAKLVSFVATAGILVALISMNTVRRRAGFFGAAIVATLLLTDPLVRFTAGKTWNHEVPAALLIAAIGALVGAAKQDRLMLTALAGALAGLAVGCRLTFAPTLVGFALLVWFFPGRVGRRLAHLSILTFAATMALAPSLYFLATEREAFIFGNLEFPRLRLVDPTNTRIQKTASVWRKVRYFFKEIVIPSWPVFLLWGLAAVAPGWRWFRTRAETDRTAAFVLLLLPFVLFGCFSPSRYQYQHSFVIIPLLLFAASSAMHWEHWRGPRKLVFLALGAVVAGILSWRSVPEYAGALNEISQRDRWYDARIREHGKEILNLAARGPILTLAPTIPIMADLTIYPEFASGPFAWRSAALVPPARRETLRLVAPDDLRSLLAVRPPAAILTGVEDEELEEPLIAWAREQGWHAISIRKKHTVWIPRPAKGSDVEGERSK